ncbi:hypothetical protein [Escherichia coli]|uniref:hypothetical protein n=1 Tax=Escherichia coli TaxID=562 RepID=UPI003F54BEF8
MESVIKQLVKIGHGMGAEVANDEPAVAKLLVELSSALDVQYERANALEAKCAALAAENAGLKECTINHAPAVEHWNAWADAEDKIPAVPETPATDAFLAEVRAQGVKSLSNAVQSVISERQRQQSVEGWTPEHGDQYGEYQLLWASSCYVLNTIQPFNRIPMDWPWAPEWWKPTNQRRDLVKAGSLILAEIERIDRQEAAQ